MATITVKVYPGSTGPLYFVTADQAGHTVIIDDYMHGQVQQSVSNPSNVTDGEGRNGKRQQTTT